MIHVMLKLIVIRTKFVYSHYEILDMWSLLTISLSNNNQHNYMRCHFDPMVICIDRLVISKYVSTFLSVITKCNVESKFSPLCQVAKLKKKSLTVDPSFLFCNTVTIFSPIAER